MRAAPAVPAIRFTDHDCTVLDGELPAEIDA